jgi:Family of unknown function (DUF5681)
MLKLKQEFKDQLKVATHGQNTVERPQNKHLKPPWKPGQSGNPGGRPKIIGRTLEQRLLEVIECDIRDPKNKKKWIKFKGRRLDMVIDALIRNACSSFPHQVSAFKTIREILEPTMAELGAAGQSGSAAGGVDRELIREFARLYMARQVKVIDVE